MKKLKELNLSVGRSPADYPGTSLNFPAGYNGQFMGNADTSHSRRTQSVAISKEDVNLEDEELQEKEEDMLNEILRARIKKNNKFSLVETLENISKAGLDTRETESFDEDNFEEVDLEEYSGAVAVAGYTVPQPGPNPNKSNTKKEQTAHHKLLEKQMNEQIERMRILEAYHQKTSNKLK